MKKKLWICFALAMLLLCSACNPDNTQNSSSLPEPASEQPQTPAPEKEIIQPVQVAEGLMDVGQMLFPGHTQRLGGRLLPDNRLLVWSDEGSALYDYWGEEVLWRSPLSVRPLGTKHFYSRKQEGENHYTITLYDKDLDILAQHESDEPAFPAIDGKTLLYDQRQIKTLNTETGAVSGFELRDIDMEYGGGIWIYSFDGEWAFFGATCNPMPGNPGIGAYNVLTGEAVFRSSFPFLFSGIPECFGQNKALFWQDGSAHGTDGTYCMLLDVANIEDYAFRKVDVGANACRMSDNGRYLAAVYSEWNPEASQIRLTRINVFDGIFLEPLSGRYFELPIESDYGGSFSGISVSDDGRYVCFSGQIEENAEKRQSLFLCELEGDFTPLSPDEILAKKERILLSVQSLLEAYKNGTVDTAPIPNSEPRFAPMPEDFIIPEITSYGQLELKYMAEMGDHAVNIESADGRWLMGISLNLAAYGNADGTIIGDGLPMAVGFIPLHTSSSGEESPDVNEQSDETAITADEQKKGASDQPIAYEPQLPDDDAIAYEPQFDPDQQVPDSNDESSSAVSFR